MVGAEPEWLLADPVASQSGLRLDDVADPPLLGHRLTMKRCI